MTPERIEGETRLRRSRDGGTVHRPGCHRGANAVSWVWAEDQSDEAIRALPWVHECRVCNPLPNRPMPPDLLEKRIWARVNKTETCWLWTGPRGKHGYAQVRHVNKRIVAHRFIYELLIGPIPEDLQLDHLCRVRHCVNPAHLEPVTNRENSLRGTSPVANNSRKTHCASGHPFAGDNVYLNTHGHRICRTCVREKNWRKRGQRNAQ